MLPHNIDQNSHLIEVSFQVARKRTPDDRDERRNDLSEKWYTLQTKGLEDSDNGIDNGGVVLDQ